MSIESTSPSLGIIKAMTQIADGAGGFTNSWATIVTDYKCRVYSAVGMIKITATGQNFLTTHKCNGEYNALIKEDQVLIVDGDTYRITQVDKVFAKDYIHHLELRLAKENFTFA